MLLTLGETLEFIDPRMINTMNIQRQLALTIRQTHACDIKLGISFPISGINKDGILFYKTSSDSYERDYDIDTSLKTEKHSRIILFDDFKYISPNIPIIIIISECGMDATSAQELDLLVRTFVSRSIEQMCRNIRQQIIIAKVNSSDIGSFFYRLIIDQGIQKLLSSKHISLFIRDWRGNSLRLKGSSTSLRSGRKAADILFQCDDTTKRVVKTHIEARPIIEFDQNSELDMNGTSHEDEPDGAWSRVYWPIKLSQDTEYELRRVADHSNDGVVRLTNCYGMSGERLPYTWVHLACLDFFSEAIFNIVDAFSSADEASFKKDEAFHNSMSVVDTIIKNIETVMDTIDDSTRLSNPLRPARFTLTPFSDNLHIPKERVFQLLRTAYASAKDISFQIARANDEVPFDKNDVTEFLIRDVLIRSVELVPDMCVAHSAMKGYDLPTISDMIREGGQYPPQVKGSPEALISVFANLFENSVKYREPDKKVIIKVRVSEISGRVVVTVRDFGVGIREGDEKRIFNRGYRGPNAHEFAPRGSGLGLSWCEKVLKTFQGSISALYLNDGLKVTVRLAKAT